ncbi:hypothetical protein LJC45_05475 [Alistipes sp. OttesenSCG-928-B03]|nr:hypothetical protein [Alistipes sp. OttesenSCG-928-B03]
MAVKRWSQNLPHCIFLGVALRNFPCYMVTSGDFTPATYFLVAAVRIYLPANSE